MTDRPIIFSAPMIRALLDGRKSQTRRILKPQPDYRGGHGSMHDPEEWGWEDECGSHISVLDICPNGFWVGDRLWCREAFRGDVGYDAYPPREWSHWPVCYEADPFEARIGLNVGRLRPSIHMPRWASRLTLTVTEVRVQRLQEISEADAVAEGIEPGRRLSCGGMSHTAVDIFCDIWNSIHGPEAWALNPWVVTLTFTVHRCNIDQMGGNNG